MNRYRNNSGLGFTPVLAAAASAAKSETVSKIVSGFTSGIQGVFGDTAEDRDRKAKAADALRRALMGDPMGEAYLLARAGIKSDANVKVAPKGAQHIFRTALRTYYKQSGITPSPDIQKALGLSLPSAPAGAPTTSPVPGVVPFVPGADVPSSVPSSVDPRLVWGLAIGGIALISFLNTRGSRR